MIKFFRKIRRRLVNEGSLKKYLLYAVGEILLVMIGILLALQVNSYNEQKKRDKLEVTTLKELKSNLLEDIEDFETNIRIHNMSVSSSKIILNALENKIAYHDSLSKHFGIIPANPIFLPTKSAYENLKSIGVHLISNDSLRTELQSLYEAMYVYIQKFTEAGYNYDYAEFGKMYQKEMSYYSMVNEARPVDYPSLFTNQELKNLIAQKIGRDEEHIIPNYEQRINTVKGIIQMIDNELEAKS